MPGRFLATLDRYRLIADGSRVLAAVSGGADSVALLDLLLLAARQRDWRVQAFHLNHGLRPGASSDERFVRELCRARGVPLTVSRADIGAWGRRLGLGVEEAGRELRYRRLEASARRLGCDVVALGHNADDNLETMLMNLCRGAGPRGLTGIPIRRGRFVRPLLDIGRNELREYLQARGEKWVEDTSNADLRFRRNLLRERVVPVLKQLNPGAVANARRAAELLRTEDRLLEALAANAVRAVVTSGGGCILIDTVKLRSYNDCLKRRVLRMAVPELDAGAVEQILDRLASGRGGRLELAGGTGARFRKHDIEITRKRGK